MNSYRAMREMRQRVLVPWTFAAIAKKSRDLPAIAVVLACAAFLFAALSQPAFAQKSLSGVAGVARDAANGKPVPDAQVIAHEMRKNTEYTTVSGTNGAFVMVLNPGGGK